MFVMHIHSASLSGLSRGLFPWPRPALIFPYDLQNVQDRSRAIWSVLENKYWAVAYGNLGIPYPIMDSITPAVFAWRLHIK